MKCVTGIGGIFFQSDDQGKHQSVSLTAGIRFEMRHSPSYTCSPL
jgi:hypothetical protein